MNSINTKYQSLVHGWINRKESNACCYAWLALSTGLFFIKSMITLRENQAEPTEKAWGKINSDSICSQDIGTL